MSKLQDAIDKANERSYKSNKYKISEEDAEKLKVFENIAEKTNLIFSFYSDTHRVKAKFILNNKKYIIDLYLDVLEDVLIGIKDKENKYHLEQIFYENFEEYLKGLLR